MHIAISGQSWQSMLFWSGQQGISADIDISVMSAALPWPRPPGHQRRQGQAGGHEDRENKVKEPAQIHTPFIPRGMEL